MYRHGSLSLGLFLGASLLAHAASADTLTGTISDRSIRRKVDLVYVEKVEKAPAATAPATMNQQGNVYLPHILPVVKGTKVLFKSEDPELHNVFARGGKKVVFNQAIVPKSTWERVLTEEGVVHLSCNIHKEMSAYILVLQNPFFTKPDPATGKFEISNLPPGTYTLRIWGEKLSDEENQRKFTATVGASAAPIELAAR